MSTPCDIDVGQLDLYEAFMQTIECMKYTYKKLIAKATVEPIHRLAATIANRLAATMPTPYVIETPRRIEFSTRLTGHRLAPLPTLGIVAPRSADGVDFPIRYNAWPTATFDPRQLAEDYVDTMKEFIERTKSNVMIAKFTTGEVLRFKLKEPKPVAIKFAFGGWTYQFSYDRDYPPAEPLTLYVEGMLYEFVEPDMYVIDVFEANVLAYETVTGEYYSGFGGFMLLVRDDANMICEIRLGGRIYALRNYQYYAVAASNVFTVVAYIPTTTSKQC